MAFLNDIDHEHTNEVVCPYCGHVHQDSYEFFTSDSECSESYCDNCGEDIIAIRHVSIKYSTKKPKGTP